MNRCSKTLTIIFLIGSALAWGHNLQEPQQEKQEKQKVFQRPKYQTQRYREDWSDLAGRDRAQSGDFFDPIKFIALNQEETVWASIGAQVRERMEVWDDFAFGGPGKRHDVFWLTRMFLHGELNIGEHFRGFIQGKSSFATDRELPGGRRATDADELELHNAFAELKAPLPLGERSQFLVRAGRQELLFGKQRLVSPLDWANTRRIFDGIIGEFTFATANFATTVTGFWTRAAVPVQKFSFNDTDTKSDFYGIYTSSTLLEPKLNLDLYWMTLDQDQRTFSGVSGRLRVHTLGMRFGGDIGASGLFFDAEGAYQCGKIGSSRIVAYMISGEIGYRFPEIYVKPVIHVGGGYASGDDAPGKGKVMTFNHLFPLGHAYMGFIDLIGRQNVTDLHTGIKLAKNFDKPFLKSLVLLVNGHVFGRAEDQDALYNPGGGVTRAGRPGSSLFVGSEIDFLLKYNIDHHLMILWGYSHFFAGSFINQTGLNDDIDFGYMIVQYTF